MSKYRISDEIWYKKNVLKWALYDLGNTIFSMVVVSLTIVNLIYIKYFNELGNGDDAVNAGNFAFAVTLFIGNIIMAMISPFLGAYSDQKQERRPLLMKLTFVTIFFMAGLGISLYTDSIVLILIIFLIANLFYQMGLVVYDAMLPFITEKESIGKVAGFGVAVGYFGSFVGIALGFILIAVGFSDFSVIVKEEGNPDKPVDVFEIGYIPYIFPLAALMFLIFAMPMFTMKEKRRTIPPKSKETIRGEVVSNVKTTGKEVWNYPSMKIFLIGWLIFIDAANTVIAFMAPMVVIGLDFGEGSTVLIVLGIGIASAVAFTYPVGVFVGKHGPKKGLVLVTFLWLTSLTIGVFTNLETSFLNTPKWPVYIFPIVLGPALGGTWVVQRQFITELAPPEKVGNYFGFANIFGRISAALGPFLWFASVLIFNKTVGFSQESANRISIVVLGVLMFIGFVILMKVEDVHQAYLSGGRATGKGTWVDENGKQLYPPIQKE